MEWANYESFQHLLTCHMLNDVLMNAHTCNLCKCHDCRESLSWLDPQARRSCFRFDSRQAKDCFKTNSQQHNSISVYDRAQQFVGCNKSYTPKREGLD